MTRTTLTEARPVVLTEAINAESGLFEIQIISPGVGSSAAYPAPVLEAAAQAKVFKAGTHLYLDHPTPTEEAERPVRSVRDLAGSLVEDATWNGSALVAKARVYSAYRPLLAEAAPDIGMSIRATATVDEGEFEGRQMPIVSELHEALSVDFVTRAGRGGAVLAVLESARTVSEATANDTREALNAALKDEYGADKTWIWVRDFDESTVWFEVETEDSTGVFAQAYSLDDDGAATLTGDRTEVRVKTQYVPVGEAARSVELTREAAITAVREARNVGQWMESRIHLGFTQVADEMFGNGKLTRDERIALSSGIGDALDAFVSAVEKAASQLYQRDLWDDPEVRAAAAEAATPSVPVDEAGHPTTTREIHMPEIEEARQRKLEEAEARVPVLEAERDAANQRADAAEQALAIEKAKDYARDFGAKRVRESNSELDSAAIEKIVGEAMREIPLTEAEKASDRRLDTEAFAKRVDEAQKDMETFLATVVQSRGGHVRGLGESTTKTEVTRDDSQVAIDEAFGRKPAATTTKGA
jgi:hypothetical protein